MKNNHIQQLQVEGFLDQSEIDGKNVHHLTTPCRIKIKATIVKSLKEKYLPEEEIGGVMWAKPSVENNEKVYVVDNISYVRNDIKDNPYTDKNGVRRTEENTYRPVQVEIDLAFKQIFSNDYLPIKFHTHPTKTKDIISQLSIEHYMTETSDQDISESKYTHPFTNHNLLMPRALIVGGSPMSNDIFIGIYGGLISPENFDESKRKVQQENFEQFLNTTSEKIDSWGLSRNEKIALGIAGVLLFGFLIYKAPKFTMGASLALVATAPLLLTNTMTIKQASYFNKLLLGDADIFIPKWSDPRTSK